MSSLVNGTGCVIQHHLPRPAGRLRASRIIMDMGRGSEVK